MADSIAEIKEKLDKALSQVIKFIIKFIKKLRKKIQNRMYHCSQLAIAIRGEQWLDTK